jgi:hypothetical protein
MFGLSLFIMAAAMTPRDHEFPETLAGALSLLTVGGHAFLRMWKRTFTSWWTYLIIPTVRLGCAIAFVSSWANLAFDRSLPQRAKGEYVVSMAIFACLWLAMWVVPVLWRMAIPPAPPSDEGATPGGGGGAAPPSGPGSPVPVGAPASQTPGRATGTLAGDVREAVGSAITLTWDAVRSAAPSRGPHAQPANSPAPTQAPRPRPDVLGAAAALAGALLLAGAVVVAMLLAVDLPSFFAAGLPSPQFREQFARDLFGPNVPRDWPALMRGVLIAVVSLLCLAALAALVFARRRSGALHLLRAVVGALGLFVAIAPFKGEFDAPTLWPDVGRLVGEGLTGAGVQLVLDRVRQPGTFAAILLFATSFIVLAWPRRRTITAWAGGGSPSPASISSSKSPSPSSSQPQSRQEGALS